jgi:hypothetical protein
MGSTAIGRTFDSISDPISQGWDRAFNGQARELEYGQRVRGDQEKAAEAAIAEQDEIKRKGKLTEERDRQRARARAVGANAGGRSSTLLTSPSAYIGGANAASSPFGGRKTLLGS